MDKTYWFLVAMLSFIFPSLFIIRTDSYECQQETLESCMIVKDHLRLGLFITMPIIFCIVYFTIRHIDNNSKTRKLTRQNNQSGRTT